MRADITHNLILDTDSYKSSHWLQYPPGTTGLVAYLESRGGLYDKTVFFGLQYILKKYLSQRITEEHVREAAAFFAHHQLPFNREGWLYIAKKLNGKIPLSISAVPEGNNIPTRNILMRVESTDEKCYWVTTWFETLLLRVWYPITVATLSWHNRQLLSSYLEKSSDTPQEVMFKLHDFGARGVSSQESAGIGGAAHLVSFSGSDTIMGMLYANTYYHADLSPSSIPASEHSTILAWEERQETDAFSHIFQELQKRSTLVALPADSYDTKHAITELWGNKLKKMVQKSGGTLVVRTDSGNPPEVVLFALQALEKAFGVTPNRKGFKVLNNVRVLHSDQINRQTIRSILETALKHNYSATNLVFGMGGALLQQVNRDTQQFAYKVSEVTVNGKAIPVHKHPVNEPSKESKGGYLDLILENGKYKTVVGKQKNSVLVPVFKNGDVLKEYTFEEVRKQAWE